MNNSTRRKIYENLIIAQPGIIAQTKSLPVCFYVNCKLVPIFDVTKNLSILKQHLKKLKKRKRKKSTVTKHTHHSTSEATLLICDVEENAQRKCAALLKNILLD